jgi:hypothetical protein
MQRGPRHILVVEEAIGAVRKGLLRCVSGTQAAEAVSRLPAEHLLHQMGSATTQTEIRKRSGLEERLKVGHAPSLSNFLANLRILDTSRWWLALQSLKSSSTNRPADRISDGRPDL